MNSRNRNYKNKKKTQTRRNRLMGVTYESLGRLAGVSRQRAWYFLKKQKKNIAELGKNQSGFPPLKHPIPGFLSITEYAKRQGFTKSQVYYKIKQNKMKFVKVGRNFFIDINDKDEKNSRLDNGEK